MMVRGPYWKNYGTKIVLQCLRERQCQHSCVRRKVVVLIQSQEEQATYLSVRVQDQDVWTGRADNLSFPWIGGGWGYDWGRTAQWRILELCLLFTFAKTDKKFKKIAICYLVLPTVRTVLLSFDAEKFKVSFTRVMVPELFQLMILLTGWKMFVNRLFLRTLKFRKLSKEYGTILFPIPSVSDPYWSQYGSSILGQYGSSILGQYGSRSGFGSGSGLGSRLFHTQNERNFV